MPPAELRARTCAWTTERPYNDSLPLNRGVPNGRPLGSGRRAPYLRRCYVIKLEQARILEMIKMIAQANSNGRSHPRPNFYRNARRPQADQQNSSNNPTQWQQKYDHYCALAQATNDGDEVTREQHWQRAEHFLRMMNGSAT
jgi:hypothetical protein